MELVRSYILCLVGGDHILSLGIERIYLLGTSGFQLVQHCVCALDKLRYDVYVDSGMNRFDGRQGAANVARP